MPSAALEGRLGMSFTQSRNQGWAERSLSRAWAPSASERSSMEMKASASVGGSTVEQRVPTQNSIPSSSGGWRRCECHHVGGVAADGDAAFIADDGWDAAGSHGAGAIPLGRNLRKA